MSGGLSEHEVDRLGELAADGHPDQVVEYVAAILASRAAPVPDRPAAEREHLPRVLPPWCEVHGQPCGTSAHREAPHTAERVGSEREAGLSQALEAACLEGLVETPHGYRYRPSVGAAAVERILAARTAALRAQQAPEVAEAVRVADDIKDFLDALTQQGHSGEVRAAVSTCLTIARAAREVDQ